jgi:peptidoglycan/LPS O-acetylase OafA/YrhL
MKYRADIDGLRAVAVLPVVLYHAGAPVPGGFVGVDVFFVISGYLICGMIDADIRNGRFSLSDFYRRRILRIAPALVVMLSVTALLAYIYFLPVEFEEFSATLASAAVSISNMYFAFSAGYFDAPALSKPLLHTWSLGVEEQFYVLAPLFMLFTAGYFPRKMREVFALLTVVSVVIQIVVYIRNASFGFYFAPCRAWELSLGGLLAISAFPGDKRGRVNDAMGVFGLIAILAAMFVGSPNTPLPIMSAAAGVGAAMVIASGRYGASLAGRLLSWRPLVFIGLISYSLYLWHWPLIVFERSDAFLAADSASFAGRGLPVLASLAIAYVSWRFIETPFRKSARSATKSSVFAGAGIALASLGVIALFGVVSNGAPYRFSDQVVSIGRYLAYDPSAAFRSGHCYVSANRQSFDAADCLRLDATRPNYLLVGDSHAAHLWLGLSKALPDVNLMQATASMCRPIAPDPGEFSITFCPRLMDLVFNDFLVRQRVDRVLLSASWKDEDLPGLARTLDVLRERGIDVVVLGPIVEYDRPLPRLLADEIRYDEPTLATTNRTAAIQGCDRELAALVAAKGARYISVYDAVCPNGICWEYADDAVPLQFDAGHLTAEGSMKVALVISQQLRKSSSAMDTLAAPVAGASKLHTNF